MRAAGIRARIVRSTTLILAVALLLAAGALAVGTWWAERAALDAHLRAVAGEVATLVDENRLPAALPVSGARHVQVIDAGGAVVSASASADRLTSLLSPTEVDAARSHPIEVPAARIAESGRLRALAVDAGPASARRTVVAAVPVQPAAQSQRGLWVGLALTVPTLLLVAAWLVHRAVGAALAPVDRLRAGAERIGIDAAPDPSRPERRAGPPASGEGGGSPHAPRLPVPEADDEIRALALTLNGMLDRLDAAAATQRRFLADAAHELRSPVAALRLQVDVAARLGEDGTRPEELLPDVERLARLVDDLLLLARVDSGHPPRAGESTRLPEVARRVLTRYEGARVPVTLHVGKPDGPDGNEVPGEVEADTLVVERVLVNLLDNAVRHARSAVQVRLHTSDADASRGSGGDVLVEVLDDGEGVAAPDRARVFERFTRLDDARARDAGGSGLGLPIVAELVRSAGGSVSLHDRPDGGPGLLARVTLPASGTGSPAGPTR